MNISFNITNLKELFLREDLTGTSIKIQRQILAPFLGRRPVTSVIILGELSLMELVYTM